MMYSTDNRQNISSGNSTRWGSLRLAPITMATTLCRPTNNWTWNAWGRWYSPWYIVNHLKSSCEVFRARIKGRPHTIYNATCVDESGTQGALFMLMYSKLQW